jgi:hypothetical protein
MRGNSDRNASLVIGQRLIDRYERSPSKEKPHALARRAEGVEKSTGVALSQDAKREEKPSFSIARQGDGNGHGTGAPHRRQKSSTTKVVKAVGKPSAPLTYPC